AARWLAGFQRVGAFYATRILRPLATSRFVSIPLVAGFAVLVVFTFKAAGGRLGFNMMETSDQGRIFIRVEAPAYYDLDATYARLLALQKRVADYVPDIRHIMTSVGKADSMSGQANEGVYMGQIEVFCAPKTQRDWRVSNILPGLRALLAEEPDLLISASEPSMMGGQSFNIEQNFSGPDLDALDQIATSIQAGCRDLPGIAFLDTTVRDTKPEIRVVPKRTVLADLGLPAASLGSIVRANVNGIEAASWKSGDRSYDIRVKLREEPGKDQIRQFLLPGADGRPIPLETVADVLDARVRTQIYRVDKTRTVKVLGSTAPGASMSAVASEMDQVINDNHLLPPGYEQSASGMAEMLGEIVADFLEAILLAIFLTLLTLSAILESWSRPALVLLTIPMALVGVLWSLVFFGYNISIMVLLGMLMLIGIVVNAAILIVDQTARNLQSGMTRRQSMLRAVDAQFRPVVMVVLASALGMLPMAISQGIGSENRVGIGTASVFGILVAGALTLVLIPTLWVLFTRKPRS
ncbi:MAG: efflux RND transporter permease subunit, partial [Kiritimatiellae bacterium]|nr:efflux RND transporter permease subunit [Kiritimatiellia bacterium]